MKRPTILLSNDDGVHAPGIRFLWEALKEADFADLVVVAPASERSGTGVGITWNRPLKIQKNHLFDNCPAWSVDGTPADCIKMAEKVILKHKPDWIISGINAGSNAGRNVFHSGTIGAVIEGALRGIPGIAFSCENNEEPNFHVARKYIAMIVQYTMQHPLPHGTILNVNVPEAAVDIVKGFCWTRQGKSRWSENPFLHEQTQHGPTYYLGGKPEELEEDEYCDIAMLKQGYLTAVPLQVHDLTDHALYDERRTHFENFFQLPV